MKRQHNFLWVVASVVLTLSLAACGGSDDSTTDDAADTSSSASTASGGGAAEIDDAPFVIALNSTPDEQYLPMLMAADDLNSQGYDIEIQQLAGSDVVFQGLASDQVQLTGDSLDPGANAIKAGAPIKIIATRNANQVIWVADSQYQDCAKLDGKPVGIYAVSAGYTTLMNLYFDAECSGIKPQLVTIPDSSLRAEAVASGEIDGTALGTPDAITLSAKYPDKDFFVLPLKEALPGVGDEYIYTNEKTIESRSSVLVAYEAAVLNATRKLYSTADADLLALVQKYLPDVETTDVAKRFISDKVWYANGGLAGPGLSATLSAFSLPGAPDDLQDTSVVTAALDEVGQSADTEF